MGDPRRRLSQSAIIVMLRKPKPTGFMTKRRIWKGRFKPREVSTGQKYEAALATATKACSASRTEFKIS